jgi:transcriptional regulator of heat shock response
MGVLGIGYKVKENYLYLNGLYDLFRNLEVSQNEIFLEIIKYFETFPQKIISQAWQNYLEQTKRRPQIFVGKNKFIKSDVVSVFADCVNSKDDKFIIFMIGPKRIDYAKILKLFRIINRREKDYF